MTNPSTRSFWTVRLTCPIPCSFSILRYDAQVGSVLHLSLETTSFEVTTHGIAHKLTAFLLAAPLFCLLNVVVLVFLWSWHPPNVTHWAELSTLVLLNFTLDNPLSWQSLRLFTKQPTILDDYLWIPHHKAQIWSNSEAKSAKTSMKSCVFRGFDSIDLVSPHYCLIAPNKLK